MSNPKPSKTPPLPEGHRVAGRYRIVSVIGEGAQGIVYQAEREQDGERVALKVIHRHLSGSEQVKKRFQREAMILKRLDGEHLVKLLDFFEEDGLLMIALEYVEGRSLEARLKEKCPLDIKEAVEIALQVCAALGAAHAAGIVHRDLKPANVLLEHPPPEPISSPAGRLSQDPAPWPAASTLARTAPAAAPAPMPTDVRVRVVDFGVAKAIHGGQVLTTTNLTEQGMIFGTAEYMAPEQARGDEADARSDLYAAGVMLYEMAVGKVPFHGPTQIAVMTAHLRETPPPPRAARPGGEISASIEAVILRALAKSPADRFANAREFAEAISAARDEQRLIANPPSFDGATSDPDVIATSDTDLHVVPPALAIAQTVLDQVVPEAPKAAAPQDHPLAETQESPAHAPPSRSRWLWAMVAIIAATVGVVLGAIIGTR